MSMDQAIVLLAQKGQRQGLLRLTVAQAQDAMDAIHKEGQPRVDLAAMIKENPARKYGNKIFGVPLVFVDDPVISDLPEDSRIAQFEQEREEAIAAAHKAMSSSYIGKPPPNLRGDADRMVAALLKLGWTPPGGTVTEIGERDHLGEMKVWEPEDSDYPHNNRIMRSLRMGGRPMRRKVIVVEDWSPVHD